MSDLDVYLVSENALTVTIGWSPPVGAQGYVFLNEAGVKLSSTLDGTRSQVKVAKSNLPVTVRALRTLAEGVYPPAVTPPPSPSVFPNAPGVFGQKAGVAGVDPSYGQAIRAATTSLVLSGGGYGVPTYFAAAADPQVTARQGLTQSAGYYGVTQSVSFRCPVNAAAATGTDHHLVVVQPDGTWVEMYHATRQADGSWLTDGLGHAQPNQDRWPRDCCREAVFTLPAGIVSLDEIAALNIPHALCGIFPNAWGRDQVNRRMVLTGAIPTTLTPIERAVALALRDYGLFVADHTSGSDMSFQCQGGVTGYPSLAGLLPLLPNLRMSA